MTSHFNMTLPQQVIITTNKGKYLTIGVKAVIIQVEKGLVPEQYYCWNSFYEMGEYFLQGQFKIKNATTKSSHKR